MRALPLLLPLLALLLAAPGFAGPGPDGLRVADGDADRRPLLADGRGASFQEEFEDDEEESDGDGEESDGDVEVDLTPDSSYPEQVFVDKNGNYKLTLPAGWEVSADAREDSNSAHRMSAIRRTATFGNVMSLQVFRFTTSRAETFSVDTPGDALKNLTEESKLFESFYGQGSASVVRPEVNESELLGDAEKSGEFEFRGITMEEQTKVDNARKLRARGDKTVEVPEYKPIVVRGRLALLSPHIYLVRVAFRRKVADDEQVVAEYKKVLDSFEFLNAEELPGPLEWANESVGNTKDDPANAKDRKQSHLHTTRGIKTYKLQLKFIVPAGFARMENGLGGNTSIALVAQDDKNNWVRIVLAHQNANALGERRRKFPPKKQQMAEWKSNWESKARGVKMNPKGGKVRLGKLGGEGFKFVVGTVEKFRGTFTGILADKSGWRTFMEMETRGDGDKVFAAGIDKFFKSLKLKKTK